MSEYIVEVSDLEESYYKYSDVKPETVFGHRLREEIVRCIDCKHFGTRNGLGLCKRWSYFSICSQPDDFCSRAERRDA